MKKNIGSILPIIIITILAVIVGTGIYLYSTREIEVPIQEEPIKTDQDKKDIKLVSLEELIGLSGSNNEFAINLFKEIAEKENTFISPYSIHTALLLAYIGSEGNTKKELEQVLALEEKEIKETVRDLKNYLENISKTTEVSIANALFLKDNFPFLESYKQDGQEYFEAEIESLPELGETINEWVREKTKDKIEEIIDAGPIDDLIVAYLVNAIYFKGIWEEEFDEKKTTERIFYGEEEREIEMMENEADYYYRKEDKLQTVTLEYKDGDYLFHAFMPIDGNLIEFYQDLTLEKIQEMKATSKGKIILRLPKFTLEQDLKLADVLQKMGIENAFNETQADFSEMVDLEKIYPNNVFINQVYHSSFIEVDEKGTEAAAATAVEMKVESLPFIPTIEFNRPLFFVIEQADTGTILFMGQLVNSPKE